METKKTKTNWARLKESLERLKGKLKKQKPPKEIKLQLKEKLKVKEKLGR